MTRSAKKLAARKAAYLAKGRDLPVPCGKCVDCCRGDAVVLYPQRGDDVRGFRTERLPDGRLMLAHKPDGDCTYLGPGGCTIHHRRPVVCHEFDCALLVHHPELASVFAADQWARLVAAGRRRIKREAEGVESSG